jgi:hypothetical protein
VAAAGAAAASAAAAAETATEAAAAAEAPAAVVRSGVGGGSCGSGCDGGGRSGSGGRGSDNSSGSGSGGGSSGRGRGRGRVGGSGGGNDGRNMVPLRAASSPMARWRTSRHPETKEEFDTSLSTVTAPQGWLNDHVSDELTYQCAHLPGAATDIEHVPVATVNMLLDGPESLQAAAE